MCTGRRCTDLWVRLLKDTKKQTNRGVIHHFHPVLIMESAILIAKLGGCQSFSDFPTWDCDLMGRFWRTQKVKNSENPTSEVLTEHTVTQWYATLFLFCFVNTVPTKGCVWFIDLGRWMSSRTVDEWIQEISKTFWRVGWHTLSARFNYIWESKDGDLITVVGVKWNEALMIMPVFWKFLIFFFFFFPPARNVKCF